MFLNDDISKRSMNLFLKQATPEIADSSNIIHRWYDYLEDFPNDLVSSCISKYNLDSSSFILDPFCGSGTTLISSKFLGINSYGADVNPLMCFISKTKTYWNINIDILNASAIFIFEGYLKRLSNEYDEEYINRQFSGMPKRELTQWMSKGMQYKVAILKECIQRIKYENIKNLLLLCLAKSAFDTSYVALCPGTTFYPNRKKDPFIKRFCERLKMIIEDLVTVDILNRSYGAVTVFNKSALELRSCLSDKFIDLIITSPPYPNDLEYTRQTRLELYLLDFVSNMQEVQDIKKKMIKGSTKLIYKEDNYSSYIKKFRSITDVVGKISEALKFKNWGFDYPKMIQEYFGTMYVSLKVFFELLKPGAHNLQVVGDQTYKNIVIPVGDIFIEMASELGYTKAEKENYRIRRSTTHNIPLPEEIVILTK